MENSRDPFVSKALKIFLPVTLPPLVSPSAVSYLLSVCCRHVLQVKCGKILFSIKNIRNTKNKTQTLAGHTNHFERLPRIIYKNKKGTIIKKK